MALPGTLAVTIRLFSFFFLSWVLPPGAAGSHPACRHSLEALRTSSELLDPASFGPRHPPETSQSQEPISCPLGISNLSEFHCFFVILRLSKHAVF